MENYKNHISIDPKVMSGKPVIKSTRITVELIMEVLTGGRSDKRLLEGYPRLREDSIRAALQFAAGNSHSSYIRKLAS
jgi:uncharacterized protein (DUF433 family)